MQFVIDIDKKMYAEILEYGIYNWYELTRALRNGKPLPKENDVDTLLQKATDEIFVQCKQFNEYFSKDWNEGFNDGMFHTLTIIKGIIEADKEVENDD